MSKKDLRIKVLRDALENLLSEVEPCRHETTHRGGFLWTICDDCGMKWADDRGGYQPYRDSPAFAAARKALDEEGANP